MTTQNDAQELLTVEFRRDALRTTDNPLQFIVHELGAIVERMPPELALEINAARMIRVTFETF